MLKYCAANAVSRIRSCFGSAIKDYLTSLQTGLAISGFSTSKQQPYQAWEIQQVDQYSQNLKKTQDQFVSRYGIYYNDPPNHGLNAAELGTPPKHIATVTQTTSPAQLFSHIQYRYIRTRNQRSISGANNAPYGPTSACTVTATADYTAPYLNNPPPIHPATNPQYPQTYAQHGITNPSLSSQHGTSDSLTVDGSSGDGHSVDQHKAVDLRVAERKAQQAQRAAQRRSAIKAAIDAIYGTREFQVHRSLLYKRLQSCSDLDALQQVIKDNFDTMCASTTVGALRVYYDIVQSHKCTQPEVKSLQKGLLDQLVQLLVAHSDAMTLTDLSNAFVQLHTLAGVPQDARRLVNRKIVKQVHELDTWQCRLILSAAATLLPVPSRLMTRVVAQFCRHICTATAGECSSVLWCLTVVGHEHVGNFARAFRTVVEGYMQHAMDEGDDVDVRAMTSVIWSCASVRYPFQVGALLHLMSVHVAELSGDSCAHVLWSLTQLQDVQRDHVVCVTQQLQNDVESLNSHTSSLALWALAQHRVADQKLVTNVSNVFSKYLHEANAQSCANAMCAVVDTSFEHSINADHVLQRVHEITRHTDTARHVHESEAQERDCTTNSDRGNGGTPTNARGTTEESTEQHHQQFAGSQEGVSQSFDARAISNAIWAGVSLRCQSPVIPRLIARLLKDVDKLPPKQLSQVSMSAAKFGHVITFEQASGMARNLARLMSVGAQSEQNATCAVNVVWSLATLGAIQPDIIVPDHVYLMRDCVQQLNVHTLPDVAKQQLFQAHLYLNVMGRVGTWSQDDVSPTHTPQRSLIARQNQISKAFGQGTEVDSNLIVCEQARVQGVQSADVGCPLLSGELLIACEAAYYASLRELQHGPKSLLHTNVERVVRDVVRDVMAEHNISNLHVVSEYITRDRGFAVDLAIIQSNVIQSHAPRANLPNHEQTSRRDMDYNDHHVLCAIDINGPYHYFKDSHQSMGSYVSRCHVMQAQGYRVVRIPWWDWTAAEQKGYQGQVQYIKHELRHVLQYPIQEQQYGHG